MYIVYMHIAMCPGYHAVGGGHKAVPLIYLRIYEASARSRSSWGLSWRSLAPKGLAHAPPCSATRKVSALPRRARALKQKQYMNSASNYDQSIHGDQGASIHWFGGNPYAWHCTLHRWMQLANLCDALTSTHQRMIYMIQFV